MIIMLSRSLFENRVPQGSPGFPRVPLNRNGFNMDIHFPHFPYCNGHLEVYRIPVYSIFGTALADGFSLDK